MAKTSTKAKTQKSLTKEKVLKDLRKIAQSWGGDIVEVSHDVYYDLDEKIPICTAPFTAWDLGCDHLNKTIYVSDWLEPEDLETYSTGIIHEMGHVFACHIAPNQMGDEEWSFLGWELALAKTIGLTQAQFCVGNKDYVLLGAEGIDIAYLSSGNLEERALLKKLLLGRVQYAQKIGLLQDTGPISIRTL